MRRRHVPRRRPRAIATVGALALLAAFLLGAAAAPAGAGGPLAPKGPADCTADLSVTVSAQMLPEYPRALVVGVDVENAGTCAVSSASVTGYAPAGVVFAMAQPTLGTADETTWTIGAMSAGSLAHLDYLAAVPLAFPSPTIASTVTVTHELVDATPGDNSAPYSVLVDPVVRTGGFHPLAPARVFDTRDGTGTPAGKMSPGSTRTLAILGRGGVPLPGVDSVVLNMTVTQATAASHLTVWPDGVAKPTASSLNFWSGSTVANLVTVRIGQTGLIDIFNNSGSVHVIADVVGWYSSEPNNGVGFSAITPDRFYDTRDKNEPFWPGDEWQFWLGAGAPYSALALNVTVTGATATSHLRVWPDDKPRPEASNLNFEAGDTRPNMVIVGLGAGDRGFKIYNNSGFVHVIIDVVGVFGLDGSLGGGFHGVTPHRVLDTRDGVGAPKARVGAGASVEVTVAGQGGVPDWAQTVVMNVTSVAPSAPTHHTIWPTGEPMPLASSLNNIPGDIRPNLVMAKIGANGKVSLYNNSGMVDLIADIVGWSG
ncbi:MAG: hypothetical protein R2726_02030 [Acidimicrobiales bacterium]